MASPLKVGANRLKEFTVKKSGEGKRFAGFLDFLHLVA
jgi:hypothetical protein